VEFQVFFLECNSRWLLLDIHYIYLSVIYICYLTLFIPHVASSTLIYSTPKTKLFLIPALVPPPPLNFVYFFHFFFQILILFDTDIFLLSLVMYFYKKYFYTLFLRLYTRKRQMKILEVR